MAHNKMVPTQITNTEYREREKFNFSIHSIFPSFHLPNLLQFVVLLSGYTPPKFIELVSPVIHSFILGVSE